jgi:GNAT superfamily N-acetyltransferase
VATAWNIRRIGIGEGLRLRSLRLSALAAAPTAFGSTHAREQRFGDEVWHQRAADGAAGLVSVTVIAEERDRWIGMASGLVGEAALAASSGPVLVGLFVDPGMRRLGIGEALVESVKSWASSRGYHRLQLWAVSNNLPALALYRRCGFQPSGATRPLAHRPELDELQMLVRLPAADCAGDTC